MKLSHIFTVSISLLLVFLLAGLAISGEKNDSKSKSDKEKQGGCESECSGKCVITKTDSSDNEAVIVMAGAEGDGLSMMYLIENGQISSESIKSLKSDITDILKDSKVNSPEFQEKLNKVLVKAGLIKVESLGALYKADQGKCTVIMRESKDGKESGDTSKEPKKIIISRKSKDGKTEVKEVESEDGVIESDDGCIITKISENDKERIIIIRSDGADLAKVTEDPEMKNIKVLLKGYSKGDISSLFKDTNPDDVIKGIDGSQVIVKLLEDGKIIMILVSRKDAETGLALDKYYGATTETKTETSTSSK